MAEQPVAAALIAEDSVSLRRRLERLLGGVPGLAVVAVAEGGTQSLALSKRQRLDLIVIDLVMPDVDGVELIVAMRDEHPASTIVVLTLQDSDRQRARCIEAGADHFLSKRTELDRLVDIALSCVSARQDVRPLAAVDESAE